MKKLLILSVFASITLLSCRGDEKSNNDLNEINQISNLTSMNSENIRFDYGESSFIKNGNVTGFYENDVWQNDISISDYDNFDVIDEGEEVILQHQNNEDYIRLKNFNTLENGLTTFDIITSSGINLNNITASTHRGPGWWGPVIEIILWLIDHTTSTSGGTKSECQDILGGCPNSGVMTYTVETGWFGIQTGSSCTVVCY